MLELLTRVQMARLHAVGRVGVAADFHLQMVRGRPEARLEQKVEDLGPVAARGTRSAFAPGRRRAGHAQPFEGSALVAAVEHDCVGRTGGGLQKYQQKD